MPDVCVPAWADVPRFEHARGFWVWVRVRVRIRDWASEAFWKIIFGWYE
jgi:hypothetical protein